MFVKTHCNVKTQTGFIWLELKSSGGLRMHKGRGVSWFAERLLASREELCCMYVQVVNP